MARVLSKTRSGRIRQQQESRQTEQLEKQKTNNENNKNKSDSWGMTAHEALRVKTLTEDAHSS